MKRLLLLFVFSPLAFGQGFFAAPQLALKTVNGLSMPLANATITVCGPNASGIPCSPALANTIYSNSALTQALSNPFTADSIGNYIFAAVSGQYTVTVTGPGFGGYSYQAQVGPSLISSIGVFTNTQQNNNIYSAIGGINPSNWYAQAPSSNRSTDAIGGGVEIPSLTTGGTGGTVHQINAIAGYILNGCDVTANSGHCNAVGGYFQNIATNNNARSWGINPAVGDSTNGTSSTLVGHWLLNEFDVSIFGSPQNATAIQINGVGTPVLMPNAFPIGSNTLAGSAAIDIIAPYENWNGLGSTPYRWPEGINFRRGSILGTAIQIEAPCILSNSCNSNAITQTAYSVGIAVTSSLQTDQLGEPFFTSTGTGVGLGLPSYNFSQKNGSAPGGVLMFCTDCKNVVDDAASAGAACLGSGHGAFAKRENARWDCN